MNLTIDLDTVEETVKERGWTIRDFCVRAKINESTWHRWKDPKLGIEPNTRTLKKVFAALQKLPDRSGK